MPENERNPDLIKEYLSRLRIQTKSPSFNEYAERLAHLPMIRAVLEGLNSKGYSSSEGSSLLGVYEQPLGTVAWGPPDFVVLREDVLIHVYLVIGSLGELTTPHLQGVWSDLRSNPSLSGVVVCWPDRDYAATVIDSFSIRNYLERPSPMNLPVDNLEPLADAIENFFQAQLVDWNLSPTGLRFSSSQRIHELSDDLRSKINERISAEQSRNYGIAEKAEALGRVSSNDIIELIEVITSMISKENTSSRKLQELEDLIEKLSQY
jgi:hypothetical protein